MEQATAQYWMLMKRKQDIVKNKVSHFQTCGDELSSWEERAFAEDHAAGSLGGCIMWPPRSYSCSFCKREFRSAQALGGHMNVHRRDRARLKQSLHLDPIHNSTTSTLTLSPPPSHHDHDHDQASLRVSNSTRGGGHGHGHGHDIGTDLSVGLNCSSSQSIMVGCKRPKLALSSSSSPPPLAAAPLQFSLKPCFEASEMKIGFKASSMEDLDLELRLGHDPPQVK